MKGLSTIGVDTANNATKEDFYNSGNAIVVFVISAGGYRCTIDNILSVFLQDEKYSIILYGGKAHNLAVNATIEFCQVSHRLFVMANLHELNSELQGNILIQVRKGRTFNYLILRFFFGGNPVRCFFNSLRQFRVILLIFCRIWSGKDRKNERYSPQLAVNTMKFVFRCPLRRFSSSLPKTVDKFVWRVRSPYKRCPCKKSSVLSQDCAILETFFMKRPDKYAYLCINLLKTPKALVVGLRLVNIS